MKNLMKFEKFTDGNINDINDTLMDSLQSIIRNTENDDPINKESSDFLLRLKIGMATNQNRNNFFMISNTFLDLQHEILDFISANKNLLTKKPY
jgi:hypothetical protein